MNKLSSLMKKIFGYIVVITLLLGGLSIVGYLIAIIIGGETAVQICDFIYNSYFPLVIQISAIGVGVGLLGIYLKKD